MTARAHGKILLFGEHAVVHGVAAIAAGLRVGVVAQAAPAPEFELRIPKWGLELHRGDDHRLADAFDKIIQTLDHPAPQRIVVEPSIPGGAGLGSSAALSVAIARALDPTVDDDTLYRASMAAESVFHGNPSGIDTACAMRGGLIRFERGTPPKIASMTLGAPVELVVAQAQPGADTGKMVAGVAERHRCHPGPMGSIFDAIGAIVEEAGAALANGDHAALGELCDINHGLLGAIGVSTPELDRACSIARDAGALGAKLTGAGGGGCIFAIVTESTADPVQDALRAAGIESFRSPISTESDSDTEPSP